MVIDIITYHNEEDIFDLRYKILEHLVDEFIVVESPSTFGGMEKELNFPKIKDKYKKVRYFVNKDTYTPEQAEFAKNSKYTNGHPRWMHEFLQKESIKEAITHLNDEDICYIGDVDEIWEHREYKGVEKLKLRVYTYYLNLLSTEEFWGTIRCKYKDIKDKCLNDVRNDISYRTQDYQGWHFTSQGGLEAVKQKVFDQYNPEVFGDATYYSLENRFGKEDFVGRDFKFEVNESDWPQYLKDNRQHYKHMLK